MSRTIKFRGVASVDVDIDFRDDLPKQGDVIYGQVVFEDEQPYIVGSVLETDEEYISLDTWCPIRPETLGQFTGLKDKNGTEVYEGDIVRCSMGCPHVMEWCQELGGKYVGGMPGWYLSGLKSGLGEGYAWTGQEEAIGNIYENPELLTADS